MKISAPASLCLQISTRAAQICSEKMKSNNWSEKTIQALTPMAQQGLAGLRTTQEKKYILHQERGIRPFLMTWVQDRTLPMACPQPLDAKVLTPSGWKPMGDLAVGDEVIDPQGHPSEVKGIYPQGNLDVFRVTLADGSQTQAAGDHLWSLDDDMVCTTLALKSRVEDLKSRPSRYRNAGSRHAPQWFPRVPAIEPVVYREDDGLPIAPYTLGALLGDGDMSDRKLLFHSADKEIVCRLEEELPGSLEIIHVKGVRYHIRLARKHLTGRTPSHPYLISLRELGLQGHTCYTKFIPESYKRASVEDRISLLRGLFDTDGSCSTTGDVTFYTTSKRLAQDVQEVVRSVGGRCSLRERASTNFSKRQGELGRFNGKPSYVLGVNSPVNLFHLTRKEERFRFRDDRRMRRIVDVTSVGTMPCLCIQVSAPSHLYLTDDFIPTHNSQGDGPHFRRGGHVGEPGYVDIPHVGRVWREQRWRHPGLKPKNFLRDSLNQALQELRPELQRQMMQILTGRLK